MDLTQGGMSMTEYASRFVQLSRFATYVIPDEEKKAKKFERGLNPRIRTMMACFDIQISFNWWIVHPSTRKGLGRAQQPPQSIE
ncbi:hypothetical protein SLA2020_441590 [Shorea laevis]